MLTMAVAAVVYYTDSIRQFALGTPVLPLVLGICPLICESPPQQPVGSQDHMCDNYLGWEYMRV